MSGTWWKDPADLIPEQIDILDLPLDKNILIKGPPGSGKTNLLLLRANYLFLADQPNINVVVLGSVLRDFIQLGSGQYNFPKDKVVTHARLFSTILNEYDLSVDTANLGFDEARSARLSSLESLNSSGKLGAIYQCLLLDEAQDYSPLEIKVFRKLTSVFIAACDSKQKIYKGDDCVPALESSTDECRELKYHFRNGRDICRLADSIMIGRPDYVSMLENSQYDESEYKSSVTPKMGLCIEEQAKSIVAQLSDQRLAYPVDILGVMCPRREDLNIIAEELQNSPLASETTKCKEAGFDPAKHIWLSTISSAKGLEFRAAHIAGLDSISKTGGAQKRLMFTAITRAKTALSLYYENSVPGYLDKGLRYFMPQDKTITKAMIFGKG